MERNIIKELIAWKNKKENKNPILLYGARQVGKTFILTKFAKENFVNYIYLNFEQNPSLSSIFENDLSIKNIIKYIEAFTNTAISQQNTLIFFDEIQVCERALTSLKYFAESETKYHVVAAGSLLGVVVNREKYSFPVGKVEIKTLFPLNFAEFLFALNKNNLIEEIKNCFLKNTPMNALLHSQAIDLFHHYLIIGGMPATVLEYQRSENLKNIIEIQSNILNAYIADMVKYATPSEIVKIRTCFDSIPAQLAKDNKKFQYRIIKKGASGSHFGSSIDWLVSSGLVYKCNRVDQGKIPLPVYKDLSAFKLYMFDVGLLCQKAGLNTTPILSEDFKGNQFAGALVENYVAQALVCNGYDIYYWESDFMSEVDFIINIQGNAIPVEVKSSLNVKSRSLNIYNQKYKPKYSIRISAKNFGFHNNIKSVPLYATFLL